MTKSRKASKKEQAYPGVEGGVSTSCTPSTRRPSTQDEELSPAGTFDTALTSPSTFDESVRLPPTPQKIIFEHDIKTSNSRSGSARLFLGMTKPALGIAALLILGAGGAAAFGWFQIPGLNSQIQELEAQVQELSIEVDRLHAENDRYESLNNRFNETVSDFQDLNDDLNATVIELKELSGGLNMTNVELIERVQDLLLENENYSRLNKQLNTTATNLTGQVEFFKLTLDKLILEKGALSNLTSSLEGITDELGHLTESQNQTLNEVYAVLDGMSSENARLASLNNDLVKLVSFLNETSIGFDNTLQNVTAFLADQIVANQVLVAESLENTYRQRIQSWDCDYLQYFNDQSFAQNFNLTITNIDIVVEFVNQRVLDELCLDESDFKQFLLNEYPDGISSFNLTRGVTLYTSKALDFYFPDSGEVGVSPEEWASAAYDCQEIQESFNWR